MEKEEIEKLKLLAKVASSQDIGFPFEILRASIEGLENYRKDLDKRNSNIWLIVKNLKPEHLEEIKKWVVPEVFTSLGIEV